MGSALFDTFSLLHFASGIIAYYWGINIKNWFIINIIYELVDNIFWKHMQKIPNLPGGKPERDYFINSVSDICFGLIGWLFAKLFDMQFDKNKNYSITNILKPKKSIFKA